MARCGVGLELQDVSFTCLNRRILDEASAHLAKGGRRRRADTLTAAFFAIVPEVSLRRLLEPARSFPHLVDLRHAQFGVQAKEESSVQNRHFVMLPVPQVLQVLVVDGGECVYAKNGEEKKRRKILQIFQQIHEKRGVS